MSNFTKSILYSTTVLAAGLVAIFSIYNNVTKTDTSAAVANITPAAGDSDIGLNFDASNIAENATEAVTGAVESAAQNTGEFVSDMAEGAGDVITDAAQNAGEYTSGGVETLNDMAAAAGENAAEIGNDISASTITETTENVTAETDQTIIEDAGTAMEAAKDQAETLENSIEAAAGETVDEAVDATVENAVENIAEEIIENKDDALEKVLNITGE